MFIPTVRRVPSRFLKPNKKRGIKNRHGEVYVYVSRGQD